MAERENLIALSEAVADGAAIDWNHVEGLETGEHSTVEQLRVIATIATVHRSAEVSGLKEEASPPSPRVLPRDTERWGSLLILETIGEGSFGRVYKAHDPRLQRDLALKVVVPRHPHTTPDHLVTEARLLARLRHPNVVTVHGADVIGDEVGLWMELVHGQTLASWVATHGRLGAEEAAVIGATLCRALAAVHQAGLLHRDIKAQNVMREPGGRIVLMDFGAGRDVLDLASAARAVGTPIYLAPEVLAGGAATVQSDIYSLGVLLFFLTTGRYPAEAASVDDLRGRHSRGELAELRDLRPDLPPEFVEVVSRALAPDPLDRFESAGRLEQVLLRTVVPSSESVSPHSAEPAVAVSFDPSRRRRLARLGALVAVVAGLAIGGAWLWRPVMSPPQSAPSIAVLPLRNLSGDPSKEYLADSLTEMLITHLTKIKGLRVLSFPAVAPFKNQIKTPAETGASLGVQYLLMGAIADDGVTLRTTVQLVVASTGASEWASDYTRDRSGLLSQQAEIARTVAAQLKVNLGTEVADRLQGRRAVSREAQDLYMRALADAYGSQRSTPTAAVELLERATEIDPLFADAWSLLAAERIRLATQYPGPDRQASYAKATNEALKAIELDPGLPAAHATLANIRFYNDWDWSGAEQMYRRGVDLAPGSSEAYLVYGMFLAAAGRTDEAIAMGRAAQLIEPLAPIVSAALATLYDYARRYPEAIRETEHALALSPGLRTANFRLCIINASLGKFDTAIDRCQDAIVSGSFIADRLELARVYALAGRRSDAERELTEVLASERGPYIGPDSIALVRAAMGDLDTAFGLLKEALTRRAPNLLWIQVDPRFDPFRVDPRFRTIVDRVRSGGR